MKSEDDEMKKRDLFPSKYICAENLAGQDVPVTIERVAIEEAEDDNGQAEQFGVVHFVGRDK